MKVWRGTSGENSVLCSRAEHIAAKWKQDNKSFERVPALSGAKMPLKRTSIAIGNAAAVLWALGRLMNCHT
jgi:hypothetical protein